MYSECYQVSFIVVGIAVLKMRRPPVNSLTLEFLQEINQALVTLEQDKSCKGLILTSVRIMNNVGIVKASS